MNPRITLTNQRPPSRHASVLVAVLACLAIAMALVTSTVRTALDGRRALRAQHQLRQTELLLAAGIQRARRQLSANSDYPGEVWELTPQVIPNIESAEVKIDVVPAAENSSRQVRLTARLSISAHTVIQRSYSFPVEANQSR